MITTLLQDFLSAIVESLEGLAAFIVSVQIWHSISCKFAWKTSIILHFHCKTVPCFSPVFKAPFGC